MRGSEIKRHVSEVVSGGDEESMRIKKMKVIFASITGGGIDSDTTAEAMKLALKRDLQWQRLQAYTIKHVNDVIQAKPATSTEDEKKRLDIIQLLVKAAVINITTKILEVQIDELYFEQDKNEMQKGIVSDMKDQDEIPWYLVHYYCVNIIGTIIKLCYLNERAADNKKFYIPRLLKYGTVEALMRFVNDREKCVLTTCCSVRVLSHLCENSPEACERAVFCGAVHKLGQFLYKDSAAKFMFKWADKEPNEFELNILGRHSDGLLPFSREGSHLPPAPRYRKKEDYVATAMNWSHTLQLEGMQLLLYCMQMNDRHRQLLMKSPATIKAVMKWLRGPPITRHDKMMVEEGAKILSSMVLNEDMAWQLIQEYNIIQAIELGVYYPLREVVHNLLATVVQLAHHNGKVKNKVGQSEELLRALSFHVNSTVPSIQIHALACCVMFSEGPTAVTMMKFIGARELYFLEDFHRFQHTSLHIAEIRRNYNKSASSQWKRAEKDFQKDVDLIVVDREQTEELKAKGNELFKRGEYEKALAQYSEAIRVCPPASRRVHTCHHLDDESNPDEQRIKQRWHILPATLYCNRAQCYLHLKQYQEAVYDCDQAVARCLDYHITDLVMQCPNVHPDCKSCTEVFDSRQDEPLVTPLVVKAMYRRSKALFELGSYHRALVDIGHCVYLEKDQPMFDSHMEKTLLRYRDNGGSECLKRCGYCSKGEGKKLKRCANCAAIYCSKDCQVNAWEKGHKSNCGSHARK